MSERYDAGLLPEPHGADDDWWQNAMRAELERAHDHYDAQIEAVEARVAELERALRSHDEWHQNLGTIGLYKDDNGQWIEVDMSLEYSDSALCRETYQALASVSEVAKAKEAVVTAAMEYMLGTPQPYGSPVAAERALSLHDTCHHLAELQAELQAGEEEGQTCERCNGTGVIDAPWSGSDPSCPDCSGEGRIYD